MEPLASGFWFCRKGVAFWAGRQDVEPAFESLESVQARFAVVGSTENRGENVVIPQAVTQIRPRPRARERAADLFSRYELSIALHRLTNCEGERFGPIRISPLQWGQRQVASLEIGAEQMSVGGGVVARSVRASESNLDRRVFARNPNCRIRTKPRGRMCWVKRRRNSVASRVIFFRLLPCA